MIERRRFLQALAACGFASSLPACAQQAVAPRFKENPFKLGIASGYPRPDGMVLWTRLLGELPPAPIPVRWEISANENFSALVSSGNTAADPQWAHSVRVEPTGLEPDRWYWYRFTAGDAASPSGRTRTAPAAGAAVARLRFAFASCQQYEQGWFSAYQHMARDDLDLVAFLGDYIYESSWGRDHVRKHEAGVPSTLDEYRARYAHYKADPDLQRAHHAFPWVATWDDHEVNNDYAGDSPGYEATSETFIARRMAAYRAFYEHMPLPAAMRPGGGEIRNEMRIYAHFDWGRLARFLVLDGRQYRGLQPCRAPGPRGAPTVEPEQCEALNDPSRSFLGAAQERWLDTALLESRSQWNLLAQPTLMAQLDRKPGEGRAFWTDGWDGYPAARKRLLGSLKGIANPVVLGGDVHSHWVADLKTDFDDPRSPVVASEFCGTSITSQGAAQKTVDERLPDNPHIKFARSDHRGYVRMSIAGGRLGAEMVGLDTVKKPESRAEVLARFAVEDGKPGPQRA